MLTLRAPLSGVIVPLDDVPDAAFAQRLAGDGVAIDPLGTELVAPCEGRVMQIHRAGHALTLDAQGLEIMMHIGLDTVNLRGDGFTPLVKNGERVREGQPLIRFDADRVARRAKSLLTQVLVTNMERVARLTPAAGVVVVGRDVLLTVERATDAVVGGRPTDGAASVESAPVAVRADAGLHARPAAMIAAAARRFTAEVRLRKGERDANARSVVSIMALEVAGGDHVTVVARGPDAAEAVRTLTELLATNLDEGLAAPSAPSASAHGRSRPAARDAAAHPAAPPATQGDVLMGVPASPGVAIGNVFQLRHEHVVIEERAADPNHEQRELDAAIAAAHVQLETLQTRVTGGGGGDRAAIFAAHQELLEDPDVLDPAIAAIRRGASAAFAWRQAYSAQATRLVALENPLLAARATDLHDVGRRVLNLLVGADPAPVAVPPESIVVAEDLTPSDTATLDRTRVRAFCTTMGSATSHAAILARGLGIPAVAGIDPRVLELPAGTRVILDGDRGSLKIGPTAQEEGAVASRLAAAQERRARDLSAAAEPARTRDGVHIEVAGNLGDVAAAAEVVTAGGDGVGLLRTEFLFMERRTAPDEDEQVRAYESVLDALGPDRLLVIRTLDVGGDKPLPYLPMPAEANPFLGERGIRLTLSRPDVFRTQLRAILRASPRGRVAVMFPMIATLAEWRAAHELLERERTALRVDRIPTGIMVETAAAALLADQFAAEADFFSIGTNDLTQYTLAMDRTNPRLAPQVDALHPAVLHLIERTVAGARVHGRWVGVCGALASDVQAIPVLVGLGVTELSADLPLVPAIKARVRSLTLEACRTTAREALRAADGASVRALVAARHPITEHA